MKIKKDYFCINCFNDINIRDFIKKNGEEITDEEYKCSFCQTDDFSHDDKYQILSYSSKKRKHLINKDLYIISQKTLNQKIIKIINEHYEFIDKPKFSEKNLLNICSILNEIFDDHTDVLTRLSKYDFIRYKKYPFNKSEYKKFIKNSTEHYTSQEIHWLNWWKPKKSFDWKEFKKHTKHKARFFDHKDSSFKVREELSLFTSSFELLKVSKKSVNIFRARESNDELKEKLKKSSTDIQAKELGKAPIKIVKNNRFSPIGISYGYFSFDKETALSEIRAEIGQEVAIGSFKLKNNLKLINFTKEYFPILYSSRKKTNPFDSDNFDILLRRSNSLYSIISDVSKPILPNDTFLEYVPTQIMSEYIWSLGYDGFIFDSSQHKDGKNIILFDYAPNYQDYDIVQVITKDIKFKVL